MLAQKDEDKLLKRLLNAKGEAIRHATKVRSRTS